MSNAPLIVVRPLLHRAIVVPTLSPVIAVIALGLGSTRSEALEFFDGRIQAHGFAEMQIRVLDEQFGDNLDLAQWYNVVNLEVEVDALPDGWGPIDLLNAFVRLETRFDCVYSRGCGMMRGADAYGEAKKVADTAVKLADGAYAAKTWSDEASARKLQPVVVVVVLYGPRDHGDRANARD